MNVILSVSSPRVALSVSRGIVGYDRSTDKLRSQLDIPEFLDSLALKIAEVPEEDVRGALCYPLNSKQVNTFRFLLGLDVNTETQEYFLEPQERPTSSYSSKKLESVNTFTALAEKPSRWRRRTKRISERELTVPTLRLLEEGEERWVTTSKLIGQLSNLFQPSGTDAEILAGRSDSYFSQKVRNMISHRDQETSFIKQGLASYSHIEQGLQITQRGRGLVAGLRS